MVIRIKLPDMPTGAWYTGEEAETVARASEAQAAKREETDPRGALHARRYAARIRKAIARAERAALHR